MSNIIIKKPLTYKENYLKEHNLTQADWIGCEFIVDGKPCNKTAIDLHHIKKRSQGGGNEASNLMPLCRDHHNKYH